MLRIIKSYKFQLIKIIYFEFKYFIRGYKGFKFNFSKNSKMTDNIPCPYFFLSKIKKHLEKNDFFRLVELGCGEGRTIDFFNKNFSQKKFVGIEYFSKQYKNCKKNFKKNKNIEIIQADFTKIDIFKYDPDYFFIGAPFKYKSEFVNFMNKTINSSNKKIFFIIANYSKKTIGNIKNIEFIESFYINENTGYSICCSAKI